MSLVFFVLLFQYHSSSKKKVGLCNNKKDNVIAFLVVLNYLISYFYDL